MHLTAGIFIALLASQSNHKPEWRRDLPRPAYRKLERVNDGQKGRLRQNQQLWAAAVSNLPLSASD